MNITREIEKWATGAIYEPGVQTPCARNKVRNKGAAVAGPGSTSSRSMMIASGSAACPGGDGVTLRCGERPDALSVVTRRAVAGQFGVSSGGR
jgi:hypothetical protein